MGRREAILQGESPDVSIVPVGTGELVTVSSTDFFSPISLDPYIQGRIAAANTLSDLYAAGCVDVASMLMILACSTKMPPAQRKIVTDRMVKGFQDACTEAGVAVTGGQSVLNPWPILGGVAIATLPRSFLVASSGLHPGDVLVLTKPLGTQVAANLAEWMLEEDRWSEASVLIDEETAARAVRLAELSMASLNRGAARAMHALGAHGATDITGFGFMGHAEKLAAVQVECVDLVLHTAPVLQGLLPLANGKMGVDFRLLNGLSAETSGGLLIAFESQEVAGRFLEEYSQDPGNPEHWGWVVGAVVAGSRQAYWEGRAVVAPRWLEV
mmetsp:Transcript_149810/g.480058  ORF Transcript_149810/g.480058 Transcript_149810/m.480058 type:complete len:327 (-) Transcript_149810:168-1148(-)